MTETTTQGFSFPDFTLVSASAGTGKTTNLTNRFLRLLLSPEVPHNGLRNILAITFTNNAAAEVKQRVLKTLKRASFGETSPLDELHRMTGMESGELARRSGELVDLILDNYSDFQVQTIDSFLARVLKVSAVEFGLPPDIGIVLETSSVFDEAFATIARELITDAGKRKLLEDLVGLINRNQGSGDRFLWNPYGRLKEEVEKISRILSLHTSPPVEERDTGEIERLKREILSLVARMDSLGHASGFERKEWFLKVVAYAQAGDVDAIVQKNLGQTLLKKSSRSGFDGASVDLEARKAELIRIVGKYARARARAYYVPYVRAYLLLGDALRKAVRQSKEFSLGEAVKVLARALDETVVPEIYFALGERIHHFLIDEFQDTSPLQWTALRPLIENSLAERGSLYLVGDTKQSIFTFRGADWRVMKRMEDNQEFASVKCRKETLETNYRSSEAVVEFVMKVFHEIVPRSIPPAIADKSGLASFHQQVQPEAKGKGYVEVISFPPDAGEGEEADARPERNALLGILADCRRRGYAYRDIAVLTPKNKHVVDTSRWLNEEGIAFISHSSLDVRARKATGELLALLRFLDSPVDDLSFAMFILGDLFRLNTREDVSGSLLRHRSEGRTDPLYVLFREDYPGLWQSFLEGLFNVVGYLPLYDLLCEVFKALKVFTTMPQEEAAFIKLLEVVKNFEEQGTSNLKEFLAYAGEEASDEAVWNIGVSPTEDAVSVMTVHKAKGQEFRVVIVLLYDGTPMSDALVVREEEGGVRLLRTIKEWREKSSELEQASEDRNVLRQIDELNKLYVALTRAKDEMHVISVRSVRGTKPSAFLPPGGYSTGVRGIVSASTPDAGSEAPRAYPVGRVLASTGEFEKLGLQERKRGEFIHAVLSRITSGGDLAGQLDDALAWHRADAPEGIDLAEVRRRVLLFLESEQFRLHCVETAGRRVLNEQELASGDGRLYRVDRLVVHPDGVTVIDYKTGGEKEEYRDQVRKYMQILNDIHPGKRIRGLLAYVDLGHVTEVV